MGNNINVAINKSKQTAINKTFQSSNSVCQAQCNNTNENINWTIIDSTVGQINAGQSCTANATCTLRTELKDLTKQAVFNAQQATAKTKGPCIGPWCVNVSNNQSQQLIENATTQVITNTCNATSDNLNEDINILIVDSKVAGFDLSQKGQATASCAISNTATNKTDQSATNQQTATSETDTSFIFVLLLLLFFLIAGFYFLNTSGKKKPEKSGGTSTSEEALVKALLQKETGSKVSGSSGSAGQEAAVVKALAASA